MHIVVLSVCCWTYSFLGELDDEVVKVRHEVFATHHLHDRRQQLASVLDENAVVLSFVTVLVILVHVFLDVLTLRLPPTRHIENVYINSRSRSKSAVTHTPVDDLLDDGYHLFHDSLVVEDTSANLIHHRLELLESCHH